MRNKPGSKHGIASPEDDGLTGITRSEEVIAERDREFVLDSIAAFAESHLAVLFEPSDEDRRLYLVTGEAFQLGDSGITRLN